MAWSAQKPMDGADSAKFLREIHTRLKFGSFTWNPPSVSASTAVDTTLTTTDSANLSGLRAGMPITVTPPSNIDVGLLLQSWVAADDTLTIRLLNFTGSPINMASGEWAFTGGLV